MHFWKMNGAGNDFVVLDNRDMGLDLAPEAIARLCNRQRGVGADGLLAVEPPRDGGDYRMRYYNADGGEAEMCGNGARCFARFVHKLHSGELSGLRFETPAGLIGAEYLGDLVRIELSEPFDLELNLSLDVEGEAFTVHRVNTGVPHAVVLVDDLEDIDILRQGSALRHHAQFAPAGTNVNFAQLRPDGALAIRTYERGVEDETLACGTGMVANAIIHHELTGAAAPIRVAVRGGDTLEVGFTKTGDGVYQDVTLTGPAEFTFEGEIELSELTA